MTKKLYQQLLNSALRRRLKEMTNWNFSEFVLFNIAFLFLVTSLRLCFSELYFAFLAWNFQDYTFVLLF
jgi:hypothetical protein